MKILNRFLSATATSDLLDLMAPGVKVAWTTSWTCCREFSYSEPPFKTNIFRNHLVKGLEEHRRNELLSSTGWKLVFKFQNPKRRPRRAVWKLSNNSWCYSLQVEFFLPLENFSSAFKIFQMIGSCWLKLSEDNLLKVIYHIQSKQSKTKMI